MLGLEKLEIARNTLEAHLGPKVSSITMNELLLRVRIVLTDGNVVAIYFNDHDQYSSSILFSRSERDRARFDNFDKNWKVRTAPHHFHARNREHAIESPMRGRSLVMQREALTSVMMDEPRAMSNFIQVYYNGIG